MASPKLRAMRVELRLVADGRRERGAVGRIGWRRTRRRRSALRSRRSLRRSSQTAPRRESELRTLRNARVSSSRNIRSVHPSNAAALTDDVPARRAPARCRYMHRNRARPLAWMGSASGGTGTSVRRGPGPPWPTSAHPIAWRQANPPLTSKAARRPTELRPSLSSRYREAVPDVREREGSLPSELIRCLLRKSIPSTRS